MTETQATKLDTRRNRAGLIHTADLQARYTTVSSESDQAATGKSATIRVYAVTVHDQRGDAPRWDRNAWLVEEVRTSRWDGEEPVVEQTLVIASEMPQPRVSARFGDATDTIDRRSPMYEVGSVVTENGSDVLVRTIHGQRHSLRVRVSTGSR